MTIITPTTTATTKTFTTTTKTTQYNITQVVSAWRSFQLYFFSLKTQQHKTKKKHFLGNAGGISWASESCDSFVYSGNQAKTYGKNLTVNYLLIVFKYFQNL